MRDTAPEHGICQRGDPQGDSLLGGSCYMRNEEMAKQGSENHGLAGMLT